MIKVTKPGKDDKIMVGSCQKCGVEVECVTSDTRLGATGQEMQIVRFIECPSCDNRHLYVREKDQG